LRLVRQLLTESLLLAGLGGAAGLFLSSWATGILLGLLPSNQYLISVDLRPDARIFAFTAAISMLTGLLFGTAPAWGSTKVDVNQAIKGVAAAPGRRRFLWSRLLVAAEMAACLILVMGAGLFIRSLVNLKTFDAGFSRETILQTRLELGESGYKDAKLAAAQQQLLERLRVAPGVRSASLSASGFHDGGTMTCCISVPGHTPVPGENQSIHENSVSPGYFRTMGTILLMGRDFTQSDAAKSPRVAVINETMARKYFGQASPLGKKYSGSGNGDIEIVGVAKDAKYEELREETPPMAFYPLSQTNPANGSDVLVRLMPGMSVESVTVEVRKVVAAVLPGVPAPVVSSVGEQVDDSVSTDRVIAQLSGFFGLLAMTLGCIGIYGVTSYSVARRTSEIGIRMALGAQRAHVLRMVLRESAALVLAGVAIGVPVAILGGRLIASMLFGLNPSDPMTLVAAVAIMLAVALLASYLPARRAAAVEPVSALRYQ
jgi:predicted permease